MTTCRGTLTGLLHNCFLTYNYAVYADESAIGYFQEQVNWIAKNTINKIKIYSYVAIKGAILMKVVLVCQSAEVIYFICN